MQNRYCYECCYFDPIHKPENDTKIYEEMQFKGFPPMGMCCRFPPSDKEIVYEHGSQHEYPLVTYKTRCCGEFDIDLKPIKSDKE